jgi:hypothetical protein
MKRAAVGFRVHSGWAAMVAVSLEKDGPRVLWRGRPHLVDTFTYEFRQPYHTAEKMPLELAGSFISRMDSEAVALAEQTIASVKAELGKQGYELRTFALLLASGKALPSLDMIIASHALIHTADGELFRAAVVYAGKQSGLAAFSIKDRELLATASTVLKVTPKRLSAKLTALGKPQGSPWSQDEKFAALAAWLALRVRKGS